MNMIKLVTTTLASTLFALPVFAITADELINLKDITEKLGAIMCYVSIVYPQSSGEEKGKYVHDVAIKLYGENFMVEYVNNPYPDARLAILTNYLQENCSEAFMESNWD